MMLHSWRFIFGFLPITIPLFIGLLKTFHSANLAVVFLTVGSLYFAAVPSVANVALLLGSTVFNYLLAGWMGAGSTPAYLARWVLGFGVTANLALLVYFKYLGFVLDSVTTVLESPQQPQSLDLISLGLSFLTFQQIAFLVDSYREKGHQEDRRFSHYLLFVSFFPKLLAGPIVRNHEFFPQIATLSQTVSRVALVEGLTRFIFGLFEKVVVADTLAHYVGPVFDAATAGKSLGLVAAWGGLLAFTFQLYFDFAGYTNMALGVARMAGFTLPENFASPYKAVSISDFWRRWHLTLSRFLRDYLYIPLGGNQKGFARHVMNLMITMVLGGLWHGAGWTFVLWGALHGLYLSVNHAWRKSGWTCSNRAGWLLTFLGVAYAWVWFRTDSPAAALRMSSALVGAQGLWSEGVSEALSALEQPMGDELSAIAGVVGLLDVTVIYDRWAIHPFGILLSEPNLQMLSLVLAGMMVWVFPNAQEWLAHARRYFGDRWPASAGALLASLLFIALLFSLYESTHAFVYSKF